MKHTLKAALLGLIATTLTASAVHADYPTRWDANKGPHLLSAQPATDKDYTFFVEGELLFWDTYQTDMDFAMEGRGDITTTFDSSQEFLAGQIHSIDFDWDVGFRLTAGAITPYDGWDVKLVFTHFHPDASERVITPGSSSSVATGGLYLWPLLWHPGDDDDGAAGATARMEIDYDVIDLLVGNPCFVRETIACHPFFGVRVLLLDQRHHVEYFDEQFDSEASGTQAVVDFNSDYWGAGLHCGTSVYWNLGQGMSLVVKGAGSLIAGCSKTHQLLKDDGSRKVDIHNKQGELRPGLEGKIGFNWERALDNRLSYVRAHISYEITQWFNTNHARRFYGDGHTSSTISPDGAVLGASESSNGGNIAFHGVSAGAELHF